MRVDLKMNRTRRTALVLILCCTALSVLWGSFVARNSSLGMTDFKALFYGSRCLIAHTDPYNYNDLQHAYLSDGSKIPPEPGLADLFKRSVFVCVNVPTSLFLLIPFAWLPVTLACILWGALMAIGINLSAFLMWDLSSSKAPRLALLLVSLLASNCVILFTYGNAACLVISLCVVAVWCFLKDKFVPAGVICMALSLAIKPHDAGLVWLYFLLAGGVYRKRALQTLIATTLICVPAVLFVSYAVPHWLPELRSNIQLASLPGGLNDPSPASVGFHNPDPMINLQSFVSVLCADPRIYVPFSYLLSAALLLPWMFATLRSRISRHQAWLGLAAISAISMLVTYHRQHDAKLLLLTIPACALLWEEQRLLGWLAILLNGATLLCTGDLPATVISIVTRQISPGSDMFDHLTAALAVRPAPLLLFSLAAFYVRVYVGRCRQEQEVPDRDTPKVVWSSELETANNS